MKQPVVYIMASGRNGTLYTGVTSALVDRTWQHREHVVKGFTKRYEVTMLVWVEVHATMESAITREKQIKAWKRDWKIANDREGQSVLARPVVGHRGLETTIKNKGAGFLPSQE